MNKSFLVSIAGTIAIGLLIGAFIASKTSPSASASANPSASARANGAFSASSSQATNPSSAARAVGTSANGQTAGRVGSNSNPTQSEVDSSGRTNQGLGSRALVGSIVSRDGDTLTLNTQQGTVKVSIANAKVQKTVDGSAEDLKPDQRVTITGQRNADDTFTATTVQIMPEGERAGHVGQGSDRGPAPVPTSTSQ